MALTWFEERHWSSHIDEISFIIEHPTDGKYNATREDRYGRKVLMTVLGSFDTLEEAQAACEASYAGPPPSKA